MLYPNNKIIIVCGHYGSGKTNIAVNLAMQLAKNNVKTALVDLDIVNPYFRAADNRHQLEALGVRCILPQFANTNVDIPCLPPEVFSVFSTDETVIFDVGGDKDGATALGFYRNAIKNCGYDMIGVCNMYRPLTSTPDEAIENLAEIELQCGLSFTSFVNNSNLGEETAEKTVTDSFEYSLEIEKKSHLPLLFTSVKQEIGENLREAVPYNRIFYINDITKKIYYPV